MRINSCIKIASCLAAGFFSATLLASPDIEHWITKNGARVYFVHAPEIPMVDMRIVFDAGMGFTVGSAVTCAEFC